MFCNHVAAIINIIYRHHLWNASQRFMLSGFGRGLHPPCPSRDRFWHRWIMGYRPRTHHARTGAGCPLSVVVGSMFLPEPVPELPIVLLAYRRHIPTFRGAPMKIVRAEWRTSTVRAPASSKWALASSKSGCVFVERSRPVARRCGLVSVWTVLNV